MALDEGGGRLERTSYAAASGAILRTGPRPLSHQDAVRFDGAARGATRIQKAIALAMIAGALALCVAAPTLVWDLLSGAGLAVFAMAACIRMGSALIPPSRKASPSLTDDALPTYSVILPLFREARVVDDLIGAMRAIDYPAERLQVILTLEADDHETVEAIRSAALPSFCEVLIAGPGTPRTKPRACNLALDIARGDYVVIYDAEDRPDPGQLREAAARFAAGPAELACLQAPLRVEDCKSFIGRQFALEYAVQFEVLLPAMARFGMAFPLGGTSNHFRTAVLRDLGGWDAFNVTEDADLGFRMSANGWRMDTLSLPTWETPPQTLLEWLPQRTRWQKGHLQTLGVHTRRWSEMRRHLASLIVTLLSGTICALVHGPVMAFTVALALIAACEHVWPPIDATAFALLCAGWFAAGVAALMAIQRTRQPLNIRDVVAQPLYWPLQSLAMAHAIVRLIREPFAWDKTPHAARQAGRAVPAPLSPQHDRPQDRRRPAHPGLAAVE